MGNQSSYTTHSSLPSRHNNASSGYDILNSKSSKAMGLSHASSDLQSQKIFLTRQTDSSFIEKKLTFTAQISGLEQQN